MAEAERWSNLSKDTTKVGVLIVNDSDKILSTGFNGMPFGADNSIKSRYDKNKKGYYLEHAERMAIFNCAKRGISTNNATIYCTYYPCADCARAIIQSGIKSVVCKKMPDFNHEKWGESWSIANELFNECEIDVKFIDK